MPHIVIVNRKAEVLESKLTGKDKRGGLNWSRGDVRVGSVNVLEERRGEVGGKLGVDSSGGGSGGSGTCRRREGGPGG